MPGALLDQLAEGGIMVIPVGTPYGYQELMKITRTARGYERQRLMPVRFVPLLDGIPRLGEWEGVEEPASGPGEPNG